MSEKLSGKATIPRLTKGIVTKYERMRALAQEESALNARIRQLNKERKELADEIEEAFGDRDMMRLKADLGLEKRVVIYPEATVHRKAYVIVKWEEVKL